MQLTTKKSYLVLDAEHLCYRNYYAQSNLQTSTGLKSGAFYGTLRSIKALHNKFGFDRMYVVWGDRRENLKRRQYYSEYKSQRGEQPTDYLHQVDHLKGFFASLNIPQYFAEGYEADDVIAYLCSQFPKDIQVYVITGDKDLHQIITENICILNPNKKEEVNLQNFSQIFNLPTPRHLVPYLALLGDTSDGIQGVNGIGEVNAQKMVTDISIKHIRDWFLFTTKIDRYTQLLFEQASTYLRNLDLIDLTESPISIFRDKTFAGLSRYGGNVNLTEAQKYLNMYEIKSLQINDIPHPPITQQVQAPTTPTKIDRFVGEYNFLSNFWFCSIEYRGELYPSVEHFYQAQKSTNPYVRQQIACLKTPAEAKKAGGAIKDDFREDWEAIKLKVMRYGLEKKFIDLELRQKLIATGDAYLEEGNNWHDNFWGNCSCPSCISIEGRNELGKLLMQVRHGAKLLSVTKPEPVSACARCQKLFLSRSHIVNSKLHKGIEILFVAEAPGRDEDIEGREPLIGQAGQKFDSMIAQAGLSRDQVGLSNICRCWPGPGNRNPEQDEIDNCLPYLLKEIEYYKPKVIVPMGNIALRALTGNEYTSIQAARKLPYIEKNGMLLMPTWHPAYILRTPAEEPTFVRDIQKVVKHLRGEAITTEVDYGMLNTVEELADYLNRMKQFPTNVFDWETTSLWPAEGEILCIALSARPFEARVFAFYGHLMQQLRPEEENEKARDLLKDHFNSHPEIVKIAHNAEFEYRWFVEKILYRNNFNYQQLVSKGETLAVRKALPNLQDTQNMHYLCDENSPHGLDALSGRFTDKISYWGDVDQLKKWNRHKFEPVSLEQVKFLQSLNSPIAKYVNNALLKYDPQKEPGMFWKDVFGDECYVYIPADILHEYANSDGDVTHRLYLIFLHEIQRQGLTEFAYKYFLPWIKFFARVKMYGIKVDVPYLKDLIAKYTENIQEKETFLYSLPDVKKAEAKIFQQTINKEIDKVTQRYNQHTSKGSRSVQGVTIEDYLDKFVHKKVREGKIKEEPINFNSNPQLQVLFFDVLKLKQVKTTDKGKPSLDKEALGIYEEQGIPFVKDLMELRRLEDFKATFLEGALRNLKGDRLHTDLILHGPVTGRLSSRNPNMQNIPSSRVDPEKSKEIRDMFITDEGYCFLAIDYAQIEWRIFAHYSQDPVMIEDIRNGLDIHRYIASKVFNVPEDQVTKKQRSQTKFTNFGFMYGRGLKSVADEHGMTIEEAQQIKNYLFGRYPKAQQWLIDIVNEAKRNKQIKNLYGRIRHLQGYIDSDIEQVRAQAERQTVNCIDFATECLTQRGWCLYSEISLTDLLLTKNMITGELEWQFPTAINIFPDYKGQVYRFTNKSFNAVTTPNHRWLITNNHENKKVMVRTSDNLSLYGNHAIHRTGNYKNNSTKYSDDFVRLVGWVLTDGFYKKSKIWNLSGVGITQNERANHDNVIEIDSMFTRLRFSKVSRSYHSSIPDQIYWTFANDVSKQIRKMFPERVLTPQFLCDLSIAQLKLLRDTMYKGGGSFSGAWRFGTRTRKGADIFQMLCAMCGDASTFWWRDMRKYNTTMLKYLKQKSINSKGIYQVTVLNRQTVQLQKAHVKVNEEQIGMWCPTVPNSFFVVRRQGAVYITGNSPIQGGASDTNNLASFLCQKEIDAFVQKMKEVLDAHVVLLIHDQIIFQVKKEQLSKVNSLADRIMKDPSPLIKVPLDIEPEAGFRLGSLQPVDKFIEENHL